MLSIVSLFYLIVIGQISLRKQLENDELFTLNIAMLPGFGEVWAALLTGAEQLPPFFYVITRVSLSLFGENNLALRLPAILGVWVMGLCLFAFVTKRSTALYGLTAMLFPLITGAYYYAFEARPYGLVLGFSGLGLICWQSWADGEKRALSLAGLTLSLAAAVSCHYYAVLILIPFACGQAARMLARRRPDYWIWAAMAASLTPLLFFLPLIRSARSYSAAFWARPGWSDITGFYYFMLISAAVPLTLILILTFCYTAFIATQESESDATFSFGLFRHELVAAIGFLSIPIVAVAMAMYITRAFTYRYALPATLGLAILLSFAFRHLIRGRDTLTIILVLLLAFSFVSRAGKTLHESARVVNSREGTVKMLLSAQNTSLPVVCSDPHTFLVLSHYAPPQLRSRLAYLADPEASMRYLGHDSLERGMLDLLKPWFRLNVQEFQPFIDSRRQFLLCGGPDHFLNWVLQDLVSTGRRVELLDRSGDSLLFLVSMDKRPGTFDQGGQEIKKQSE
ncbi:MAG: glycosyltransferase family 39 protein [Acidobacteria bacterium]|nr:glycosyltransferase family 39 protein [Acidobacteriota bacterium]